MDHCNEAASRRGIWRYLQQEHIVGSLVSLKIILYRRNLVYTCLLDSCLRSLVSYRKMEMG